MVKQCLFAVALILANSALAQSFPSKPIRVVVPFPPGGGTDILSRLVAKKLIETTGWQVVVDNRAGAGGNIGGNVVAKAAPDGYTLLLATTGPAANNKLVYKNMPYDPQRDLAPIVLYGKAPVIITARNSLPAHTLKEFVEYAKQNPGKITAGYPGNGTQGHITGELLQQRARISFAQTQYRGSPAIITDLLGDPDAWLLIDVGGSMQRHDRKPPRPHSHGVEHVRSPGALAPASGNWTAARSESAPPSLAVGGHSTAPGGCR